MIIHSVNPLHMLLAFDMKELLILSSALQAYRQSPEGVPPALIVQGRFVPPAQVAAAVDNFTSNISSAYERLDIKVFPGLPDVEKSTTTETVN